MNPLPPEAVAQMVEELRAADKPLIQSGPFMQTRERLRNAADMLTTLAAENATLRTYNTELCDNYNSQLVKLAHQDDELATLRASEAAAMGRVKVLETALKFYRGAWSFKTSKRYGGLEWFPTEQLLDDCGNVATDALTPTADKEPKP